MAGISTGINLQDNFSPIAFGIINSVNIMVEQMNDMKNIMGQEADTIYLDGIREQMQEAMLAAQNLDREIKNLESETNQLPAIHRSYNSEMDSSVLGANSLLGTLGKVAATYATIESVKNVVEASDNMALTQARLNLMNDGLQTTDDLLNMVFISAQDARGSLSDMADVVARFGNNAGAAFDSSAEVVQFSNLIQKQMTIAGASTQEASATMLQLSQALGSGVLRGDELNSVLEQSPLIVQNISKYIENNDTLLASIAASMKMKVDDLRGNVNNNIRDIASEGLISADIVKNAMFAAADDINKQFESMPVTFGQVMTSFGNIATIAFLPLMREINNVINSKEFLDFFAEATNWIAIAAGYATDAFSLIGSGISFIVDNLNVIAPIIAGIVTAQLFYNGAIAAHNVIQTISNTAHFIAAAYTVMHARATGQLTKAQLTYNSSLLTSPTTWFIGRLILIITVIFAVSAVIVNTTHVAKSSLGVICGGVATAVAFIGNVAIGLLNTLVTIGIEVGNFFINFATSLPGIFSHPILTIENMFLSLFNFITGVINSAAKLIDTVFGTNLSGDIGQMQLALQAQINTNREKMGMSEVKTLDAASYTIDRLKYGDAFKSGAKFGDGISEKIKGKISDKLKEKAIKIPKQEDYPNAIPTSSNLGSDVSNIAANTEKTAKSLEITSEDLKYLRDIAERDVVNRYTTAQIKVEQTNHNTINSNRDLDGVVEHLKNTVEEQMHAAAEGVY